MDAIPSNELTNRLGAEISPYLLQHKNNPVAWQPWGDSAFSAAKRQKKPVLLSVGYAACHWCHVMAHESFENPQIAELMNTLFINIKVDREERPDVDSIYQSALNLMGENGGWPLTIFMTPAGEPFWGGTYFPPDPRFGRPGFPQVLKAISATYRDDPNKVQHNVDALVTALSKLSQNKSGDAFKPETVELVAERLLSAVDPREGGLGSAPKFPQPTLLKFLWRAWKRTKQENHRNAVELSLSKMSQGGIYDHLGGGFARYTVDDRWLVPHFEKMLYDNAQLIQCLTWAWLDGGLPLYEVRVRETIDWVMREMRAQAGPDGGQVAAFAASLDADSEGEEGKFYVWQEDEVDHLLGADAAPFKAAYGVTAAGNWEGKNILNRSHDPDLKDATSESRLAEARTILLAARDQRVRPGWDDKVLADWCGLMITALADAATAFSEPSWLEAGIAAFDFVREHMSEDGRLLHCWRRGRLLHPATLEDYANMSEAALALFEADGDNRFLAAARAWAEILDRHYWDKENGGYFQTADDTRDLLLRPKSAQDNATPNGNATLISVLARLYHFTGDRAFLERAEALANAFGGELERNPIALTGLLNGAALLRQALQIVVIGQRGSADCDAMLAAAFSTCQPDRCLQVIASDAELPDGHPARGKKQIDDKATAFLCRGQTCSLAMTDPHELRKALLV